MSAASNVFWAGLGVAAGYALALYIDQQVDDQEGEDDGDREVDAPNLRVVDDDEVTRHPFEYIDDEISDA